MKGKITGCIAMLWSVAYGIYSCWYWYFGGSFSATDTSLTNTPGVVSLSLATALTTPHTMCSMIGAIMIAIGFFGKMRWAMLTGAILLAAACVLFPLYAFIILIPCILAFISYARMKVNN